MICSPLSTQELICSPLSTQEICFHSTSPILYKYLKRRKEKLVCNWGWSKSFCLWYKNPQVLICNFVFSSQQTKSTLKSAVVMNTLDDKGLYQWDKAIPYNITSWNSKETHSNNYSFCLWISSKVQYFSCFHICLVLSLRVFKYKFHFFLKNG